MKRVVQKDMASKVARVTRAGQISLPARVRSRWNTHSVAVEDHGDHVVVRPLPEDPIAAARGALRGRITGGDALRRRARADEDAALARR